MIAERPTDTVERFIHQGWNLNDIQKERLVAELLSVSNETHRRTDSSYYSIIGGKLIDPETARPILEYIAPGVEYGVALDLQDWVSMSEEGVSWWISPKLKDVYPCNKAMIYQIAYDMQGAKTLLYSAILFDGDIENSEEYRKTLFHGNDEDETIFGILSWIEKVSGEKQEVTVEDTNAKSQASYFAERIKSGVSPRIIVNEMQTSGFIGQHSISCPKQSFANYGSSTARLLIFSKKERTWKFDKKGICVACPPEQKTEKWLGPCGVCQKCEEEIDRNEAFAQAA